MKSSIHGRSVPLKEAIGTVAQALGKQLLFFFGGVVASSITLIGDLRPFGVAYVAAVPSEGLVAAFLGAVLRYFLPFDITSLRYVIAVAAMAALKVALFRLIRPPKPEVWDFASTAVLLFFTGAVAVGTDFSALMLCLGEGMIGGAASYFAFESFRLRHPSRDGVSLRTESALFITVALAVTGLFRVPIGPIPLGAVASAALLSAAGEYGGAGVGSFAGALAGAASFLGGFGSPFAVVFPLSGAAAGLVGGRGKIAVGSVGLITSVLLAALCGFPAGSTGMLAGYLLGVLVYLLVPSSMTSHAAVLLRRPPVTSGTEGLRKSIGMRLSFAANALVSVGNRVQDVAGKLSATDRPAFSRVLHGVMLDACAGCTFYSACWERDRKTTEQAVISLADAVRQRTPLDLAELPVSFASRCPRKERVETAVSKYYTRYLAEDDADRHAEELRGAVTDQFAGLAQMLADLSEEFRRSEQYDEPLAASLASAVSGLGLIAKECTVMTDRFDRMQVEMRLSAPPDIAISRARLRAITDSLCGRSFDIPSMIKADRDTLVTLTEKPVFELDKSVFQIKSSSSPVCGDTADTFTDGRGHALLVMSDGMGTGSRAAIDSSMVCGLFYKLILSGFGYACALKLINVAMMYRSAAESLATLDVAVIDLFTGETTLYKAGAAPTLVLRGGKLGKAECNSLPVGILRGVAFDKATFTLAPGDRLVMVSDGAAGEDIHALATQFEQESDASPTALSERLAKAAAARQPEGHADDITVIVAALEKAVG